MMRQKLSISLIAAAFTLTLSPAWAQERERPQSEPSRPSNGETTGSAVPRGNGGGATATPSAGGGGSTSSSSGSAGGASSGSSTPFMGSFPTHERAPVRPERIDRSDRNEQQRRGGGSGSTTGRAVPRGESGGGNGGNSGGVGATSSRAGSESQPSSDGRSRAVPTYSRPRDGRAPVGTAVERRGPVPDRDRRGGYYYDPYYSFYYDPYYSGRYSYWSPFGYGYGLGYFSYDPFLFSGFGYPGYYGGGYYDPYYYGGAGAGAGAGAGYGSGYGRGSGAVGALRLKVKPANAQVYIDGYYVGVIDSFDGAFQRLSVEAGTHRVELKAEGFEPVEFEVMVIPGDTITYKGDMKRR